jgi:hypothetical protein
LAPLLEYGLDLTMPIGSCGVAMSREQLSYIPKTSENVKKALEGVIDDVVATFSTFFDNCDTEWEAMKLLADETGLDSYARTGRAQLLMANAKYKGVKLETSFRLTDMPDTRAWMIEPRQSRRGQRVPPAKWGGLSDMYGITPGRIEEVIIDDLPQSPKSKTMARIREYCESQPQVKQILVIRGKDEHQTKFLVDLLKGPKDYTLTSSLPEPAAAVRGPKAVRPRVRMFGFNGGRDRFTHSKISNLTPSNSKSDAVHEIKYADQPATGIMVVMDAFDLPSGFYDKMESGLVQYSELSFINKADESKLKATFERFDDVFAKRLAAALAGAADLPQRIALSKDPHISKYTPAFRQLFYSRLTSAQKQRPFGQLFSLWYEYVRPLTNDQLKLAPFVTPALPRGVNPLAIAQRFTSQQPDAVILHEVLDLDKSAHVTLFMKNL